MGFIYIIDAIKYFMEAVFCYFVYNEYNSFKNKNFKKAFVFSIVYVTILFSYRYFIAYNPTNKIISFFIILSYIWIENWIENKKIKKNSIKNWSYILTFSVFISLMAESSHFAASVINRFAWQLTGMYKISETNLALDKVYRLIILALHICFMFLVYKIRFIKMKDIKNLSVHKEIPILFGLCLSTTIYIRYYYLQLGASLYGSVLAWIFIFLLPTYLGFYRNLTKLAELKNMKRNELDDINLEEKIEQPLLCKVFSLDQYRCEHKPCAAKYEADKIAFKRVLRQLGINSGFKGFTQLVFSLLLTRNFLNYNKGWTIENNVINYIALATGEKPSEIRKDFGNIIRKVWLLEDLQVIKKGYSNTADEDNPPSVDEFLVNMAKKPIVDEAYMLNEQMF